MVTIKKRQGESRKEYLVRAAIEMLTASGYKIETIEYDDAECDAFCLADDLKNEFNIDENEDSDDNLDEEN